MNIVQVDPSSDPRWQRLVERNRSSVFHSPAWFQVLRDTYDLTPRALLLLDADGQPRAGLPFCRLRDCLGERIISLPFSDFCDPLVTDSEAWRALSDQLLEEGCPVTLRVLWNDLPRDDPRFVVLKRAAWHGVNLTPDSACLWAALHDTARRAVQKAVRSGVEVRVAASLADLRAFHALHVRLRKTKYRLLAQPLRFFESIWRRFIEPGQGALLLACLDGELIGGVLFLEWEDTLYYKFNASSPTSLAVRPNDLLTWEGMLYGKARGLRCLDLGLSDTQQDGLIRYKRKFATNEQTITFLASQPVEAWDARGSEVRALLGPLTALLTDPAVPDHVTEKAGTLLYRLFA